MDEMSMVERVARALSIADGMHPDAESNDEDSTPAWTLYVGDAKAAIEAMRMPTAGMVKAVEAEEDKRGYVASAYECMSAEDGWPVMIDAALKE